MLNIQEILEATNGKIINGKSDFIPRSYEIDSRNIKCGDFFIPIVGEKVDAHKYIIECVEKGAIGYFINKNNNDIENINSKSLEINPDICIIEVEDTLKALIDSGKYNRQKHINVPIVAVVGSVGKTSTREMITSVLKEEKNVLNTKKNYNSNIGLSLMCLEIDKQDVCVLEAGIDKFNEMEELSEILKPDIAVMTVIGTSHIGTFKNKENIFKEKSKILTYIKGMKKVVTNGDDEYLSKLIPCEKYDVEKISMDNVDKVEAKNDSLRFETRIYGNKQKIIINQIGDHNVYNALMAIKVGEYFNISKEKIIKGIANYKNFVGRLQQKSINEIVLIDDTYNASSESMRSGLITVNRLESKRKFAILGDMFDLGEKADEIHEKISEIFKITNYDYLYTLGDKAKIIAKFSKKYFKEGNVLSFDSQDEIIKQIVKEAKQGDVLYFKASNGMHFSNLFKEVEKMLEKKN